MRGRRRRLQRARRKARKRLALKLPTRTHVYYITAEGTIEEMFGRLKLQALTILL
jgi:hypothetical protein